MCIKDLLLRKSRGDPKANTWSKILSYGYQASKIIGLPKAMLIEYPLPLPLVR